MNLKGLKQWGYDKQSGDLMHWQLVLNAIVLSTGLGIFTTWRKKIIQNYWIFGPLSDILKDTREHNIGWGTKSKNPVILSDTLLLELFWV
jgi:hypothetical protein